ncbi:DUF2492 family protein [Candidatus Woesearchaeota archaeon]|nr:DUF2492 family protein [Candidatus Woesearchaeota archaeon]
MEKIIHAHKILEILENPRSLEELQETVSEKFGDSALFTNCSGKKFTFEEAISFFKEKEKIYLENTKLHLNKEKICNH